MGAAMHVCIPLTHYPLQCAWNALKYHFMMANSLEPSTNLRTQ